MRTNSRVSRSTYQIWTCERISRVEPKRFFRRRAPAATPRSRPEVRPRKLTTRSASPSGNVFRMMASVSRAGMGSRRADAAPDKCDTSEARTRGPLDLPHALRRRNACFIQKPAALSRDNRPCDANSKPSSPSLVVGKTGSRGQTTPADPGKEPLAQRPASSQARKWLPPRLTLAPKARRWNPFGGGEYSVNQAPSTTNIIGREEHPFHLLRGSLLCS